MPTVDHHASLSQNRKLMLKNKGIFIRLVFKSNSYSSDFLKRKKIYFLNEKLIAICSSENLLKKYVPSAYSYSSFYNSKKYFRVVKMSLKHVTNFFF